MRSSSASPHPPSSQPPHSLFFIPFSPRLPSFLLSLTLSLPLRILLLSCNYPSLQTSFFYPSHTIPSSLFRVQFCLYVVFLFFPLASFSFTPLPPSVFLSTFYLFFITLVIPPFFTSSSLIHLFYLSFIDLYSLSSSFVP